VKKENVILERKGDIGLLQINNPPENYLESPDFIDLDELKGFVGTGIKALVIKGAGRHFSAGADLEALNLQLQDVKAFQVKLSKGNKLLNYIDALNIPVIAAITGVCFGAGLEIVLACDIRIAEENSLFAFPEVNHSLFPGLGGATRLTEIAGRTTALELVLYGDMINAVKAEELGVIDKVVSRKTAKEHSISLAERITLNRSLSIINAVMTSLQNAKQLSAVDRIKADIALFVKLARESMNQKKD
jgi:enoyl-CoA hydratase/carnithine racemase